MKERFWELRYFLPDRKKIVCWDMLSNQNEAPKIKKRTDYYILVNPACGLKICKRKKNFYLEIKKLVKQKKRGVQKWNKNSFLLEGVEVNDKESLFLQLRDQLKFYVPELQDKKELKLLACQKEIQKLYFKNYKDNLDLKIENTVFKLDCLFQSKNNFKTYTSFCLEAAKAALIYELLEKKVFNLDLLKKDKLSNDFLSYPSFLETICT